MITIPALEAILPHALNSRAATYHTFETARNLLLNDIPGIFIECGVFSGVQVGAMCEAMQQTGQDRVIHLFDSFEGIPLCGPEDTFGQPGIGLAISHDVDSPLIERLRSSGVAVCSVQQVKNNLASWGYAAHTAIYHQGWFQHVLPNYAPEPIALLRIDADLYESIKCCLDYLLPHVVKGGLVIIDDYGPNSTGHGPRKAVEEALAGKVVTIKQVPNDGPGYWTV